MKNGTAVRRQVPTLLTKFPRRSRQGNAGPVVTAAEPQGDRDVRVTNRVMTLFACP